MNNVMSYYINNSIKLKKAIFFIILLSLFFVNGHIQAIDIDGNGVNDLCYKKLSVVEATCPEKNETPLNASVFSACNYTNLEKIKRDCNSNYVVREEITLIIASTINTPITIEGRFKKIYRR